MAAIYLVLVLVAMSSVSAESVNCYEGFNISVSGIPFYHRAESECGNKSVCFVQELETTIYNTGLKVVASYGGCISSAYSKIVTCENLFGEKSTLNPAILVNMIPDFEEKMIYLTFEFSLNSEKHLRQLFSRGGGVKQFIKGCYQFLENLGFYTADAIQLEEPITDLFSSLFFSSNDTYQSYRKRQELAVDNILQALRHPETRNRNLSSKLYSFLANWPYTMIRGSKYAPLVEHLPGLIRSSIPATWMPELWYDAIFDFMSDIHVSDLTLTAEKMVQTLKQYWKVEDEREAKFVNIILDSIPGFVDLLRFGDGNVWIDAIQHASMITDATSRLSTASTKIIQSFVRSKSSLSASLKRMVQWLPGVAYQLFPEDFNEIDRVYNVLSDGLESLDFSVPSKTMERTNMSDFMIFVVEKTGLFYPIVRSQKDSKQMVELIITNTAKTVYNLIPEYCKQLDTVFSALTKVFESYPYFNVTNLILNLGGEVPQEVKPILDHVQELLRSIYDETGLDFKPGEFRAHLLVIINEYKVIFPTSEFPTIAEKYLNLMYKSIYEYPSSPDCWSRIKDWSNDSQWDEYNKCSDDFNNKTISFNREIMDESGSIGIDLQFAIFKYLDYAENPLFKVLVETFPDFELYLRALRLLEPSDIKELIHEYSGWLYTNNIPRWQGTASLFSAWNVTMSKIMGKLENVAKDLRTLLSPDTCQYASCGSNLCNTHDALESQEMFTRDPTKRRFGEFQTRPTKTVPLTTVEFAGNTTIGSGAERAASKTILNVLAVCLLAKFI